MALVTSCPTPDGSAAYWCSLPGNFCTYTKAATKMKELPGSDERAFPKLVCMIYKAFFKRGFEYLYINKFYVLKMCRYPVKSAPPVTFAVFLSLFDTHTTCSHLRLNFHGFIAY